MRSVVVESSLTNGVGLAPGTPVASGPPSGPRGPHGRTGRCGPARTRASGRRGGRTWPGWGRGRLPPGSRGWRATSSPSATARAGRCRAPAQFSGCRSSGLPACLRSWCWPCISWRSAGDGSGSGGSRGHGSGSGGVPGGVGARWPGGCRWLADDPFRGTLVLLPLILGGLREIHRWGVRLGGRPLSREGTAAELARSRASWCCWCWPGRTWGWGDEEVLAAGLLLVLGCRVARQDGGAPAAPGREAPGAAFGAVLLAAVRGLSRHPPLVGPAPAAGRRRAVLSPGDPQPGLRLRRRSDEQLRGQRTGASSWTGRSSPSRAIRWGPRASSTRGTTRCCPWRWCRPTAWAARWGRWPPWRP